jgi:hypothetical protein
MGQLCCNTSLTAPRRNGASRATLVADQPRALPPVSNADAHHFAPVRTKLWELPELLHCSVVGTCLSTAELRKILAKLDLVRGDDTEHDLHGRGVGLAGQSSPGAKLLHKALDARHDLAIRQFARAKGEAELRSAWQEALQRGDIPGPYWAVLTHPACSYGLRRDAFGHVHMLSHLVGAANRADIRQLAELQEAKMKLEAKVERKQNQLQAAITERDRTIRDLQTALSARIGHDAPPMNDEAGHATLHRLINELNRRLDAESGRRAGLEARLEAAQQALERERLTREAAQANEQALGEELAAAEAALHTRQSDRQPGESNSPPIHGLSLLYVGGRPHQVTALQALSESRGAGFSHHDGGVEEQVGLLAGMVSRADIVFFPVDCISHEAALAVKRLCRQGGKPFVPLRSAGQGAFLASLNTLDSMRVAAE